MTDAELARIHAAAMAVPRPWNAAEIGALRLLPGIVDIARPDGFALGRVTLDEAELLTIAVHPDARRNGLGQQLLDAFHKTARIRGGRISYLEVADSNAAALGLYRAAGYVETGRRRDYYTESAPPIDAITMSRPL